MKIIYQDKLWERTGEDWFDNIETQLKETMGYDFLFRNAKGKIEGIKINGLQAESFNCSEDYRNALGLLVPEKELKLRFTVKFGQVRKMPHGGYSVRQFVDSKLSKEDFKRAKNKEAKIYFNPYSGYEKIVIVNKFPEIIETDFPFIRRYIEDWARNNEIDPIVIHRFASLILMSNHLQDKSKSNPSLVMYGERGGGKSFFTRDLLGAVMKGNLIVQKNLKALNFTPELTAKVIRFEEFEKYPEGIQQGILRDLKNNQSDKVGNVNIKFGAQYDVQIDLYHVFTSNTIPFTLEGADVPTNSSNNPWFVLEQTKKYESGSYFYDIAGDLLRDKYEGHSVSEILDMEIGAYCEFLHGIYIEDLKDSKLRYGMEIPITKALRKICNTSIKYSKIIDIFLDIYTKKENIAKLREIFSLSDRSSLLEQDSKLLFNTGFLSNRLQDYIIKATDYDAGVLNSFLAKFGSKPSRKGPQRGVRVELVKLVEYLEKVDYDYLTPDEETEEFYASTDDLFDIT